MSWRRLSGRVAAVTVGAALAVAALGAAQATAMSLVPPKPNVFLGVSDQGSTQ